MAAGPFADLYIPLFTSVLRPTFSSSSTLGIYLLVMVCATLLTNIASNAGIGIILSVMEMCGLTAESIVMKTKKKDSFLSSGCRMINRYV